MSSFREQMSSLYQSTFFADYSAETMAIVLLCWLLIVLVIILGYYNRILANELDTYTAAYEALYVRYLSIGERGQTAKALEPSPIRVDPVITLDPEDLMDYMRRKQRFR